MFHASIVAWNNLPAAPKCDTRGQAGTPQRERTGFCSLRLELGAAVEVERARDDVALDRPVHDRRQDGARLADERVDHACRHRNRRRGDDLGDRDGLQVVLRRQVQRGLALEHDELFDQRVPVLPQHRAVLQHLDDRGAAHHLAQGVAMDDLVNPAPLVLVDVLELSRQVERPPESPQHPLQGGVQADVRVVDERVQREPARGRVAVVLTVELDGRTLAIGDLVTQDPGARVRRPTLLALVPDQVDVLAVEGLEPARVGRDVQFLQRPDAGTFFDSGERSPPAADNPCAGLRLALPLGQEHPVTAERVTVVQQQVDAGDDRFLQDDFVDVTRDEVRRLVVCRRCSIRERRQCDTAGVVLPGVAWQLFHQRVVVDAVLGQVDHAYLPVVQIVPILYSSVATEVSCAKL